MASKFVIKGGKQLIGEVSLSGAKNAATKMMVASLLTDEPCILNNFPYIGDTAIVAELCQTLGSQINRNNGALRIVTPSITNFKALSLSRRNRIPVLALGPLLARAGRAEVPILGGDRIGPRPVNLHFQALNALGAEINVTENSYQAVAKNGLKGARIHFEFPSVGATENALLAAVLAKGRTVITNAAVEPEILDLIKFLQKMGAIVELGANRTIRLEGVGCLHGATHNILPDRNEAVSFACLAIATGGRISVRGAKQDDLITFISALRRIGGGCDITNGGIVFYRNGDLIATEIETDTHPGFMTDWQQPFTVLLTQARGISVVHETIYEDRFGYTEDLHQMGADIQVFAKCLGELPCRHNGKGCRHSAIIKGPTPLKGANCAVRDLRSGMVNIISALVAEGESVISGIEEIDRGYVKVDERLRKLGADIKRL